VVRLCLCVCVCVDAYSVYKNLYSKYAARFTERFSPLFVVSSLFICRVGSISSSNILTCCYIEVSSMLEKYFQ
jgi:hypothetical protein